MMKKIILFFLVFLLIIVFVQFENDDCVGLIDLGVVFVCLDIVFFFNVDVMFSDIGFGNILSCFNGGVVGNDVWFVFMISDIIFDYIIIVIGILDLSGFDFLSSL